MNGEDELFFLAESTRHARTLPLRKCLQFLSGMLSTIRGDHEAAARIQSTIAQLSSSDAQLELLQIGEYQLRLGVGSASKPKSRRTRKRGKAQ